MGGCTLTKDSNLKQKEMKFLDQLMSVVKSLDIKYSWQVDEDFKRRVIHNLKGGGCAKLPILWSSMHSPPVNSLLS